MSHETLYLLRGDVEKVGLSFISLPEGTGR
jgi:hypothetical protein